jgi:hypothetical protein
MALSAQYGSPLTQFTIGENTFKIFYSGPGGPPIVIYKYLKNGLLDSSYSTNGSSDAEYMWFTDAVVQPDGKIIVAGWFLYGGNDDLVVVRFNTDGSIEKTLTYGLRPLTYEHPLSISTQGGHYVVNGYSNTVFNPTPEYWTYVINFNIFFSKPTGDLDNLVTWGEFSDGTGLNPPDFGADKTFNLANRSTYIMTGDWTVNGQINIPSCSSSLSADRYTLSIGHPIKGLGCSQASKLLASNLKITGSGDYIFGPSSSPFQINSLTIFGSAYVRILNDIYVYGTLTNYQNLTIVPPAKLTLKSDATSTARVAPIDPYSSINGLVTVERYIPPRRAWRMISSPVGNSHVSEWQEHAINTSLNPNPNPGFGTHITGGTVFGSESNGFDQSAGSASSILTYNSSLDNWLPVANTQAPNDSAYMLFVRGDRGIELGTNDVPATPTILRATGELKQGDQTFPISATGFTAIPNPFASPINFVTITRNNVQNSFYLWDPKMGGEYGVGAYVLVSFNGNSYDVTPASVSAESEFIQSGQAFMVHSTGEAGSLVIKETDKCETPAMDVFRTSSDGEAMNRSTNVSNTSKGLRITLQALNPDNTTATLDETFSSYNSKFSNKTDEFDALKLSNIKENLAIVRGNKTFMLERRSGIATNDTIRLKLWNTQPKTYFLEFNPINLSSTVKSALLVDNYLHTSTPVSLSKKSQVSFTVNADAASASASRFMVTLSTVAYIVAPDGKKAINTYPNPISGKVINVQMVNQPQGMYAVELVNNVGQVVYKGSIAHAGGSAVQTIQLENKIAAGLYQLRIMEKGKTTTLKIIAN